MRTIGLRATPDIIYFCVGEYEQTENKFKIYNLDKIIIPIALDIPDQLSFIRTLLYTIVLKYEIEAAIIRTAEGDVENFDLMSVNLEGVIQELISNCNIAKYKSCKIYQLSILLNKKVKDINDCVKGNNLFDINNWNNYKTEEREGILSALAATLL